MPYTFELSFTGMCILSFTPGPGEPHPTEVNVLLLKGPRMGMPEHDHLPYLSYSGRNRVQRTADAGTPVAVLVPGPDGAQIVLEQLEGQKVTLELPSALSSLPLSATWRSAPTLPATPRAGADEDCLDWIMALQRVNPEMKAPRSDPPYNGLKSVDGGGQPLFSSLVNLTAGNLRAADFPRGDANQYVQWEFRIAPRENDVPVATHAMAGRAILSIPEIPDTDTLDLVLTDLKTNQDTLAVTLGPRKLPDGTYENMVYASVTNLPSAEDSSLAYLSHFAHFYDAAEFNPRPEGWKLRLPTQLGGLITSTTVFCPPPGNGK